MGSITALEEAAQLGMTQQHELTYGYYRKADGWITVSPATELEELTYGRDGWKLLHEYGRIEMGNEYAADHPLERLFQLGGAKELPKDQIIKMGLHINSPLVPVCAKRLDQFHKRHVPTCWKGAKPVKFPQLKNPPKALVCTFGCGRENLPTEEAKQQHESVAHKEERSDIRMGETLANSLTQGIAGLTGSGQPYTCPHCKAGFDAIGPFATHVQGEEAKNAVKV